jgi:membrane protein required for colicin V production
MIIDIIAGCLIAFGLYQGFSNGLIKTVFATISIIIAIVAALKLSPILIAVLQENINFNPAILFVLGFVLSFIVIMALIRFIGNRMEKLFEKLYINSINKVAGAAVLSLFYAVLFSFTLHFLNRIELISEQQKSNSYSYPILKPLPEISAGVGRELRPVFTEFWDAFMKTMNDIKEKANEIKEADS